MARDLKMIFLFQPSFRLFEKFDLFIYEVGIFHHPVTSRADQMMVMPRALGPFGELITGPSVPEIQLTDHAEIEKKLQCPVNRGQAHVWISGMYLHIDILGAHMSFGTGK
jgi:hypothetical protein